MIGYFIALSFALFAIGIGGMASSRHFLIMMISSEAAIAASALLATAFFSYVSAGNILALLLSVWSVAAMEAITLIAVYRYMARTGTPMDVTKLSKLKN
jgi:NADH:ubiquinone oxidoreductase subunit K